MKLKLKPDLIISKTGFTVQTPTVEIYTAVVNALIDAGFSWF